MIKYTTTHCGISLIEDSGVYYYIDKYDKKISIDFDSVWNFRYNIGIVKLNGKYGFITTTNTNVTLTDFDDIFVYNEHFLICFYDGKWGVIDLNLNLIVPCKYKDRTLITQNIIDNYMRILKIKSF
jgi:hypothetical protein